MIGQFFPVESVYTTELLYCRILSYYSDIQGVGMTFYTSSLYPDKNSLSMNIPKY